MYDADIFLFVIANSPVVAGMKQIGDHISIDDGMLDLLAVKKQDCHGLCPCSRPILRNSTERENILHIRAKEFEIRTDELLCSDIDGECGPLLPLRIRTLPMALSVYC